MEPLNTFKAIQSTEPSMERAASLLSLPLKLWRKIYDLVSTDKNDTERFSCVCKSFKSFTEYDTKTQSYLRRYTSIIVKTPPNFHLLRHNVDRISTQFEDGAIIRYSDKNLHIYDSMTNTSLAVSLVADQIYAIKVQKQPRRFFIEGVTKDYTLEPNRGVWKIQESVNQTSPEKFSSIFSDLTKQGNQAPPLNLSIDFVINLERLAMMLHSHCNFQSYMLFENAMQNLMFDLEDFSKKNNLPLNNKIINIHEAFYRKKITVMAPNLVTIEDNETKTARTIKIPTPPDPITDSAYQSGFLVIAREKSCLIQVIDIVAEEVITTYQTRSHVKSVYINQDGIAAVLKGHEAIQLWSLKPKVFQNDQVIEYPDNSKNKKRTHSKNFH